MLREGRVSVTTGIDPRVLRDQLAAPHDRRGTTGRDDVSARPWPPPSRGPLPPADSLPADLNIGSAQDETDAWAHEHDHATELLARLRRELAGDGERDGIEIEFLRQRSKARRKARASPTERGRRTSADIDAEVEEALIESGILARKLDVEASIEIAVGRLFRARDNIGRLESYVRSLPRVSDGGRYG